MLDGQLESHAQAIVSVAIVVIAHVSIAREPCAVHVVRSRAFSATRLTDEHAPNMADLDRRGRSSSCTSTVLEPNHEAAIASTSVFMKRPFLFNDTALDSFCPSTLQRTAIRENKRLTAVVFPKISFEFQKRVSEV